jgi:sporulation protein YqfC
MFLDELYKITGLPFPETFNDYKLVNVAGKTIYVQNYLKLISYNKEKIVLKVKNNELNIDGKNLTISELSNKNILVKGYIFKSYLTKETINNEKS